MKEIPNVLENDDEFSRAWRVRFRRQVRQFALELRKSQPLPVDCHQDTLNRSDVDDEFDRHRARSRG